MKFEIKSWLNGSVIYSGEGASLSVVVQAAVKAQVSLAYANLRDADLSDADLRAANLRDADLSDDQLIFFRDDIFAVLSGAPAEVPALISALAEGRVDGSTYHGECSCLVGTLAKARNCRVEDIETIQANARRPAEQFFMQIKKGDKPKTNRFSKLAHQWAEEWLKRMQATFAVKAK